MLGFASVAAVFPFAYVVTVGTLRQFGKNLEKTAPNSL